jgi:hypothetical protein
MPGKLSWQSTVVAVAFIALVALFYVFGLIQASSKPDFMALWGTVGTIVGVVVGAIPSFFFKAQADKATGQAEQAQAAADQHAERFTALASVADPSLVAKAVDAAPRAFRDWNPL